MKVKLIAEVQLSEAPRASTKYVYQGENGERFSFASDPSFSFTWHILEGFVDRTNAVIEEFVSAMMFRRDIHELEVKELG